MKLNYVKGDLIELFDDGQFDAIVHGCNCFHVMGAGIALHLNDYTKGKLLEVDSETDYGNINKLGLFSVLETDKGRIYNLYTQYTTARPGKVAVHWISVLTGLHDIIKDLGEGDVSIGIPLIGCGLANGKREHFELVLKQLSEYFSDRVELTVVEFE